MAENRTPDWPQLRDSGLFDVIDQPGLIVVKQPARDMVRMKRALLIAWGFVVFFPLLLGPVAWLASLFMLAPFLGWFTWKAIQGIHRCPLEVRFTPDSIEFYKLGGKFDGRLERRAMQQIVPRKDERKAYRHRFIAEDGWHTAFTDPSEMNATLKNNLLMAAFRQPVHLDTMDVARAVQPGRA